MKTDWSPIDALPDLNYYPVPAPIDLRHVVGCRHNGLPEVKPYRWRRGEAEREAAIQERLAAIRARLLADENVELG